MAGENIWTDKPYYQLGNKLREARQKSKETLAEVSSSVEVDLDTLSSIENGEKRPNEDTLMLLISHFNFNDDQAGDLWELAGYSNPMVEMEGLKPLAAIIPIDNRVMYTDTVHIMINGYGVVMNFMQNSGSNNQPLAVARVGMSKEHARSVLEVLKKTLEQSDSPKQIKSLPAPTTKKRKNR